MCMNYVNDNIVGVIYFNRRTISNLKVKINYGFDLSITKILIDLKRLEKLLITRFKNSKSSVIYIEQNETVKTIRYFFTFDPHFQESYLQVVRIF